MAKDKAKKKVKVTFFKDFKAFISKGNIIDLAIAVVIGGAFGAIVTSLVEDIIMPLISWAFHGANASQLQAPLGRPYMDLNGNLVQTYLKYGNFIQFILNFLIIALCIFIAYRIIKKTSAKIKTAKDKNAPQPAPSAPPEPTKEELLLTEIRDLLKEQSSAGKAKAAAAELAAQGISETDKND